MLSISLIRMFIAIAIIFNSLYYIWETKKFKFLFSVLFASLFHYSALIMVIFIPLAFNQRVLQNNWKKLLIILFFIYPIGIVLLSSFIANYMGSRYAAYALVKDFEFSFSSYSLLPVLVYTLWRKKIIPPKYLNIYITLLSLLTFSSIVSFFGSMIDFGRVVFYMNLSLLILLPMIYRFENNTILKMLAFNIIVSYSLLYLYVSQFNNELNSLYLFPYNNMFFKI